MPCIARSCWNRRWVCLGYNDGSCGLCRLWQVAHHPRRRRKLRRGNTANFRAIDSKTMCATSCCPTLAESTTRTSQMRAARLVMMLTCHPRSLQVGFPLVKHAGTLRQEELGLCPISSLGRVRRMGRHFSCKLTGGEVSDLKTRCRAPRMLLADKGYDGVSIR